MGRTGLRELLGRIPDAEVVELLDFKTAYRRGGWSEIDCVICDVRKNVRTGFVRDEGEHPLPGIDVMEAIKAHDPAPLVIAVTSDYDVWQEDVVRRQLQELGVEHFMLQSDLEDYLLSRTVASTGAENFVVDLPALEAVNEIPELGVTGRTRLRELVKALEPRTELLAKSKVSKSEESEVRTLRAKATGAAASLDAKTVGGDRSTREVSIRQLRSVIHRARLRWRHDP